MTPLSPPPETTPIFSWVYVVGIKRFVHDETFAALDAEQFNALYASRTYYDDDGYLITAATFFLRSSMGRLVRRLTYRPAAPRFLIEGDESALNTYRDPTVKLTLDEPCPWLDLLAHIFPDATARDHFLDYSAHLVQRPGEKPNHAIAVGSVEGVGKDSLIRPLIEAVGSHNVGTLTAVDLESQFNDWVRGKVLHIVEEIQVFEKRTLANRLKPLLAAPPDDIRVNAKFLPAFTVPNICRFIFFTNSKEPIALEEGDRRWWWYWAPAEPKPAAYYLAYHQWCDEHPGDVYGYLMFRNLANFNPKARPPLTSAKTALVEDSRPLLRQHLQAIVEGSPDLVTINSVVERLPPGPLKATSPRAISKVLVELGARELRQVRLLNGDRRRVWALRRWEMYTAMTEGKLAERFSEMRQVSLPGVRSV